MKDIQEERRVAMDSVASRMGNKTIEVSGIMRKPRDGHKRQNQYDLEKLKVGKLTVLTFFPSEIFV